MNAQHKAEIVHLTDSEQEAVCICAEAGNDGRTETETIALCNAHLRVVEEIIAARMAQAWDEARSAKPQYLGPDNGHYPGDCMGWEDCYCASYPNPYREVVTPPENTNAVATRPNQQ